MTVLAISDRQFDSLPRRARLSRQLSCRWAALVASSSHTQCPQDLRAMGQLALLISTTKIWQEDMKLSNHTAQCSTIEGVSQLGQATTWSRWPRAQVGWVWGLTCTKTSTLMRLSNQLWKSKCFRSTSVYSRAKLPNQTKSWAREQRNGAKCKIKLKGLKYTSRTSTNSTFCRIQWPTS